MRRRWPAWAPSWPWGWWMQVGLRVHPCAGHVFAHQLLLQAWAQSTWSSFPCYALVVCVRAEGWFTSFTLDGLLRLHRYNCSVLGLAVRQSLGPACINSALTDGVPHRHWLHSWAQMAA